MEKINRDTKVLELVENQIQAGYLLIIAKVVHQLRCGQNPHLQGIDYTYPAGDIVQAIAMTENMEIEAVWKECQPHWLKRFDTLIQEIAKEQGIDIS